MSSDPIKVLLSLREGSAWMLKLQSATLSILISRNSRRSSRLEASDVIEQRDGPSGMGRDDVRGGGLAIAGCRRKRALMPG